MTQTRVIVPTYNEKENLTPLVERLLAQPLPLGIIVVDDNSPDGTGEIAVIAQGSRVTYPARSSQGNAIKRGSLVVIDQMLGTQALVSPE
jgi:glycosyltransferase involved in cell wall biosynthesis